MKFIINKFAAKIYQVAFFFNMRFINNKSVDNFVNVHNKHQIVVPNI